MRRKVDEIGRKLDILSDLLRESRLSMDILQGLHYIVQGLIIIIYYSTFCTFSRCICLFLKRRSVLWLNLLFSIHTQSHCSHS